MSRWTYELTEEDRALARELAEKRDAGRPNEAHKGHVGAAESARKHVQGLRGEIAFGQTFGLDVDRQIRRFGDRGFDFQTEGGIRVEVKYRDERGRDFALKGETLHSFPAHVGVLTWPAEGGQVQLVGWTTPTALLFRGRKGEWPGVGEKLYITPESLFEMDDLYRLVVIS